MRGKYSKLIEEYCQEEGIHVPPGFKRRAASHLAIFCFDSETPRLVAKTFFKKEDLKRYINLNLVELTPMDENLLPVKVIDFKESKYFWVDAFGKLVEL